jgi:hypothetical protein
MEIQITQTDIENYVANSEEFWNTFHASLQSPYSSWSNYKNETLDNWQSLCYPNIAPYLNFLFEFPVLKGEYVICFAQGMLLTNYRLLMNDVNSGKYSIPLDDIINYSDEKYSVVFNQNGKKMKLDWISIDKNFVNSAINRNENKALTDVQKYLLSTTFFDLKNKYFLENVPQAIMPPYKIYTSMSGDKNFEAGTHSESNAVNDFISSLISKDHKFYNVITVFKTFFEKIFSISNIKFIIILTVLTIINAIVYSNASSGFLSVFSITLFVLALCSIGFGILGLFFGLSFFNVSKVVSTLMIIAFFISPAVKSDSSGSSSSSSYSSGSHTCGDCGTSFSGNGWNTVGGEQYQQSSWNGFGYCSKRCAYNAQPSNWKR